MAYIFVFIFGSAVGAAELISRHSDHRLTAITTGPSIAYLILNGLLSIFALVVIGLVHPSWLGYNVDAAGKVSQPDQLVWVILTAGFGAAAFFRSSIFKIKTTDGDLAIGPSIVIDVFLNVIDESVDRIIGQQRIKEVSVIMQKIDFAKAHTGLPTLCFATLKRLSPEAQTQFAFQLKQLVDAQNVTNEVKVLSLGMSIMNLTGKPILEECVSQIRSTICLP